MGNGLSFGVRALIVVAGAAALWFLIPAAYKGAAGLARKVQPGWENATPLQKGLLAMGVTLAVVPGALIGPTVWYANRIATTAPTTPNA